MEEKVRFEQYQRRLDHVLASCIDEKPVQDPKQVHPVELAYIGDAVFSLYVRRRLLPVSSHVQVLHDLAARMVSAVMQARGHGRTGRGSDGGRKAGSPAGDGIPKSTVPKSASVREYRQGTAFEALMGYLYLMDQKERLHQLMDRSFWCSIQQPCWRKGTKRNDACETDPLYSGSGPYGGHERPALLFAHQGPKNWSEAQREGSSRPAWCGGWGQMGHTSTFEHVKSFTFAIEGVSRVLTHQLVRHRIASYSQQSQRYVKEHNFETILPPTIAARPECKKQFQELCGKIQDLYNQWTEAGIPAEDARYILPNAAETKIVVTMNARSCCTSSSCAAAPVPSGKSGLWPGRCCAR